MQFYSRLVELQRKRVAFAVATVVAHRLSESMHLGDRAIIYADGRMEGFIGSSYSREVVRREALKAIRTGKPRLLQIRPNDLPEDLVAGDAGRVMVPMAFESEGAADVYIEPSLPPRMLVIAGHTPVAEALSRLAAATLEFDVVRVVSDDELRDLKAPSEIHVVALEDLRSFLGDLDSDTRTRLVAIVASQATYDESALEVLLGGSASFIGLVGSRRHASMVKGVLAQQGIPGDRLMTIRNPIGLEIGDNSPAEAAVSILAEIIAPAPAIEEPSQTHTTEDVIVFAADPVCGSDVEIATAPTYTAYHGQTYFFCSSACRSAFALDPEKYVTESVASRRDA
jgi:xanthine dehydrogenase accessory factor